MQLSVCSRFRRTANGTSHGADIGADGEFVLHQLIHSPFVHHNKHDIGLTGSNLQTNAAAFDSNRRRSAPSSVRFAADHDAFSILGADHKSRALQVGNNSYT